MKKFFLILFIVSFLAGSVWGLKNQTSVRIDSFDKQQLAEKPDPSRTYNWQAYAVGGEATNLNWPVPERATFFEIYDFCLSGPVTIEQVSHLFYEHGDYPWPDATFHFKIYDADGTTLLHESGDLEAAHYVEYFYTLPTPLVVTNDFYVAVVPTDVSGHPSSMSTSAHDGHSYNGSAGAFVFYPGFEYITGVYIDGGDTGERISVLPVAHDFGVVALGNTATQTFVIENYCPTGTITIDPAPGLTGDAVFTIITDTGAPYPTTVPTDMTSISVTVQFAPVVGQAYSTVLNIYDNLTDNTTAINIVGVGFLQDCDWTIVGVDSYGDGWNGGSVDIVIGGIQMYNYAGPDPLIGTDPDTLSFGISEGEDIDLVWNPGTWDGEVTYEVFNNFGASVFTDGPNPTGTTGIYGTCIIPPCALPVDLVTESVSATSATLKWSPGPDGEILWDVRWGIPGFDPELGEGTLIGGLTDTTTVLINLTGATGYDWYVRADCGTRIVSGWGSGASFFTSSPNDGCQSAINIGEVVDMPFDTTPATISGQGSCVTGSDLWYKYTPSATGTATFDLCGSSFDTMLGVYSGSCLSLTLIECNDDAAYCDARSLQSAVLDVPVVLGSSYYIQLGGYGVSVGTGDLTITLNTCPDPVDQVVTNLTQTTADLGWTEYGVTTDWQIEIGATPFTPTGIPTNLTSLNPLSLTNLLTATEYAWYVKSDCGVRDSSNWVGPNTFTTLDACPIPSGLAVSNLLDTSVTLDWNLMPGATDYNWEIVLRDSLQGHGVIDFGTVTPNTASSTLLTQNTLYDYRVESNCPDRAVSGWSTAFSFATPCATLTAPYTESFENGGLIPSCWTSYSSTGELWRYNNTNGGHSAPSDHTTGTGYFAWVDDSSSESPDVTLLSPVVDISGLTTPQLSFWLYSDNETHADATITVDIFDGTTWQVGVFTHVGNTPGWEEQILALSTYAGPVQVKFIVDEVNSDYYDDISLDDVSFREAPLCPDPTLLTVTNETLVGADLGWTSVDSFFDIYIVTTGSAAPGPLTTPTVDNNAGTTYTWAGGTDDTVYDWYVRADCAAGGGTGQSDWTGPSTFATLFDGIQIGSGINVGQHLPIESYYGYTYSQSIYLASEFGTPGANKQIQKILYNYSWNGGDDDSDTWTIYMGTTANTALTDYLPVAGLTQVFSGDVNLELVSGDGWLEISLSTPFNYDPALDGNLVIAVDENEPSYTTGSDEFYCDLDARANVSIWYYSDSTNPDPAAPPTGTLSAYYPNTRFVIGDTPIVPIFDIDPDNKDFGSVFVDFSSAPQTFTMNNVGANELIISSVTLTGTGADQFTLTDLNIYPDTLTTNSITVDVTFDPTSAGVKSAFLTVVDNLARATHDIPLTGTGTTPPLGDVITNPFIVGALPYNDTGDTSVGFTDNYGPYGDALLMTNLLCTNLSYFSTSTLGAGPDVVYEITLATPTELIIDLCASDFDTAVALVSGDGLDPEDVLLIDDDSYLSGAEGCAACCESYIHCSVPVPAGTYYILVGGYGSSSGYYDLTISEVVVPTAPINITISTTANATAGTDVIITWDAVAGAATYNVYRTDDPYATFPDDWTAYTGIVGTAWNYTSQSVAKFYQVTASSLAGSTDVIGKDKGEDHSIKGTHVEKVRK